MKILWITNSPLNDAFIRFNKEIPVTGGWFRAAALDIIHTYQEVKLANAALFDCEEYTAFSANNVNYYLIPINKSKLKLEKRFKNYWESILSDFNPDVVHIHGTEYPHSFSFVKETNFKNVVVSIQGLVSIIHNYYKGDIKNYDLIRNITLRDIYRRDTIFDQLRSLKKRGEFEVELLQRVSNVIGRTQWDKSHSWRINPEVNYHFCNESLREVFYEKSWNIEKCEPYSIFLSQAHYPIKGLHKFLFALRIIIKHYPSVKVSIAGNSLYNIPRWRQNGYSNYIKTLIKKFKLKKHIEFVGKLSEDEMCAQYLKSNVFVCPSIIENSPNSVGEAQALGVPCVASFVGGMSDMIENNYSGILYRFEEIEMLAKAVCEIFSNKELAIKISKNGRETALIRHDRKKNIEQLKLIYDKILSNDQTNSKTNI